MVRCRGLLVQFGIAADPAQQLKWNVPIKDDRAIGSLRFKRGTLSFAGMGPNTRTTNLFLADAPRGNAKPRAVYIHGYKVWSLV